MVAETRPGEPLTRSSEDYLKAIYRLSADGEPATTSDLATTLELTPASVSGMMRRLAEQGLVEHLPYYGVKLTARGRRIALRMLRRHRLIETFLVDRLGYTWDTVHEEAERLEHAVSDDLVERIAVALGHPRVDPHGDPIPDADGHIADFLYVPLADVALGESVVIRRVDTADDRMLRYLASAGLVPGATVRVSDREPFDGPTTLRVGDRTQVVGREVASIIHCSREVA